MCRYQIMPKTGVGSRASLLCCPSSDHVPQLACSCFLCPPHQCRVRWLSRERVVKRLCTLYDPLLDFFKEEAEKKEKGAQAIYDTLR